MDYFNTGIFLKWEKDTESIINSLNNIIRSGIDKSHHRSIYLVMNQIRQLQYEFDENPKITNVNFKAILNNIFHQDPTISGIVTRILFDPNADLSRLATKDIILPNLKNRKV